MCTGAQGKAQGPLQKGAPWFDPSRSHRGRSGPMKMTRSHEVWMSRSASQSWSASRRPCCIQFGHAAASVSGLNNLVQAEGTPWPNRRNLHSETTLTLTRAPPLLEAFQGSSTDAMDLRLPPLRLRSLCQDRFLIVDTLLRVAS